MRIRRTGRVASLIAVLCLVAAPASALTISFSGPTIVSTGDTFSWNVFATGVFDGRPGEEVIAFGFDVGIGNPALVNFVGASVGPLFDDVSASFANTAVAGLAPFLSPINETTLLEPLLLASLRFQALNAGTLSLGIVSDLADLNEGLFYLTQTADITTSRPLAIVSAIVPVPPTHALLVLALALTGLSSLPRQR